MKSRRDFLPASRQAGATSFSNRAFYECRYGMRTAGGASLALNQGGGPSFLRINKPPHSLNCCDDLAETGTACRAPTAPRRCGRPGKLGRSPPAADLRQAAPLRIRVVICAGCLWLWWRRDWRDVFFQVTKQKGVEVEGGAWAFVYGVGAVGVFHEVYWFV
jgi:hypothetical protein